MHRIVFVLLALLVCCGAAAAGLTVSIACCEGQALASSCWIVPRRAHPCVISVSPGTPLISNLTVSLVYDGAPTVLTFPTYIVVPAGNNTADFNIFANLPDEAGSLLRPVPDHITVDSAVGIVIEVLPIVPIDLVATA